MCKSPFKADVNILNGEFLFILQLIIELWGIQDADKKDKLIKNVTDQRANLAPTGLGVFGKKDKSEVEQAKELKYNEAVDDWKNKLEGWQDRRLEQKLTAHIGDEDFAKKIIDIAPSEKLAPEEKSSDKSRKREAGKALKTIHFSDLPAQAPRVIQDIMSGKGGLRFIAKKREYNGFNVDDYDPEKDGKRSVSANGAGIVRSFHQNESGVLLEHSAEAIDDAVNNEKDEGKRAISAAWHELYGKDVPKDGNVNLQKKQRDKGKEAKETGYYEVNVDEPGGDHIQSRLIFDYVNFCFYFAEQHAYLEPQLVKIPDKLIEEWLAEAAKNTGKSAGSRSGTGQANQHLRAVRPSDGGNGDGAGNGTGTLFFVRGGQYYTRHYTLGDGHCLYRAVLARIGSQALQHQFRTASEPNIMVSIRNLRLMTLIEMLNMRAAYIAGGEQDHSLMVSNDDIINAIAYGWGGDAELRAMARLFPQFRFEITPTWNQPIVYNDSIVANNRNTVRLYFTGNHYEHVSKQ